MVHITAETAEKFKKIFKEEYGVDYSDQEAYEGTHNFLGLFELLLEMDRKQQNKNKDLYE